jgi:hypothetical protein
MCANCGFPAAPGHWTEAGIEESFNRLQARHRRASLLRDILRDHGLTAHDDGSTPGITISTLTGRQEIAYDLSAVWEVAEQLIGRPIDPLAPRFTGGVEDAPDGETRGSIKAAE